MDNFDDLCARPTRGAVSSFHVISKLSEYVTTSDFSPGMGYHFPSQSLNTICGRSMVALHKPSWQHYMFHPTRTLATETADLRGEARNYVKDKCRTLHTKGQLQISSHGFFDVGRSSKSKLDNFLDFVGMLTDNEYLKRLTLTETRHDSPLVMAQRFYRLSFQQLMLIDVILTMIKRCKLQEHQLLILNYIKERIGLGCFSTAHLKTLGQRLNTVASGYVIPRRCGKTSFVCALITLILIFAPAAGLKILYTAQRDDLCKNAYETVLINLAFLVAKFNTMHLDQHRNNETRAMKNKEIYEKPFYCAIPRVDQNAKKISVSFFLRTGRTAAVGVAGEDGDEQVGENVFLSRVYAMANVHRGATYNLMFVDETNYLSPKIFPELMPNLLLQGSKMICTTSQRNGQDTKPFVDLKKIRMDAVLSCVIEYVCPNHCVALIRQENLFFSTCICYMFAQPLHINVVSFMRRLLEAFSTSSSSSTGNAGGGGSSYGNSKAAILSEIGIMPPGLNAEALDHLDASANIKMVSEEGRKHFLSERIDLGQHIRDIFANNNKNTGRPRFHVHDKVLTYLDPTPTSHRTGKKNNNDSAAATNDASKHAMVTITAMQDDAGEITRYIILGVEEFTTEQYEPTTHHAGRAMAHVYMAHLITLHRLYHGYFTDYYLIPEINSYDLDDMWYNCEKLLYQNQTLLEGVNVYTPCMVSREKNSAKNTSLQKRKAAIENVSLDGLFHSHMKRQRTADGGVDNNFHQIDMALARDSRTLALSIEELKNKLVHRHESDGKIYKFKLGFRLAKDKLQRFLHFFNNVYNKAATRRATADITMAKAAVSWSLMRRHNLAEYVADKLECVYIRTEVKANGVKVHRVSGKKGLHGKHETDDVAVCTVMAQTLYSYYTQLQPKEDDEEQLLRLEAKE